MKKIAELMLSSKKNEGHDLRCFAEGSQTSPVTTKILEFHKKYQITVQIKKENLQES